MRLALLFDELPPSAADVEISSLAYDNRLVTDGALFFCVPGFTRDGHDFAADAVARGAVALVVERPLGARRARGPGPVGARRDGAGRRALLRRPHGTARTTVGVTGTNGKTTTAFLMRALLESGGRQTGLLGTVKSVIGGVEHEVLRTTPEAIDLQRTFREMLDAGDEACVMEVSSHALELAPRRRDPLRRGDLHQPHPGPPRLPRDDGGVLRGQAAALHRPGARACGGQRRRSVRRAAGRRARRTAITFALDARRDISRRRDPDRARRLAVHRDGPGRRVRAQLAADRALQRLQRPGGVRHGPGAGRGRGDRDRGDRRGRAGARAAFSQSARARIRRARRLRAHPGLA